METKRSSALSIASIVLAGRANETKIDETMNERTEEIPPHNSALSKQLNSVNSHEKLEESDERVYKTGLKENNKIRILVSKNNSNTKLSNNLMPASLKDNIKVDSSEFKITT